MKTLNEIRGKRIAVFTFGRMNPPTRGHEKLIHKVLEVAAKNGGTPRIYVSSTQDPTKNPLTQKQKIKYLRLGIPDAAKAILDDPRVTSPYVAIKSLEQEGFTDIIMVVGADRVNNFKDVQKYVRHPDKSKSFDIDSFQVVSAGSRDPDSDDVDGMSATKMRQAAVQDDFGRFRSGVPSKLTDRFAKEMFDMVKRGLRLAESVIILRNTLDIPRNKMPQINYHDIEDFMSSLEKHGIAVSIQPRVVGELMPTQREVDLDKIKKKCDAIESGEHPIKPFIVSSDNFILDGHHQLFALQDIDHHAMVSSYVVDLRMTDLLWYANKFPRTTYKEIDE